MTEQNIRSPRVRRAASGKRWVYFALLLALVAVGGVGRDTAAAAKQSATASGWVDVADLPANLHMGHPTRALCKHKTYRIGLEFWGDQDPFALTNIASFRQVAGQLGCVQFVGPLFDATDPSKVIENMQTFVERKVDGVVLALIVPATQPGAVRILKQANVKVLSIYVPIPNTTFLDEDDVDSGYKMGRELISRFLAKYPGKTPYVIFGGLRSVPAAVGREQGFDKALKKLMPHLPKDHYTEVEVAGDPVVANRATAAALAKIPKDALILAPAIDDQSAFGMLKAAHAAGYTGRVMAWAQGGSPAGLRFICGDPDFIGTIAYQPEKWGIYVLPAIMDVINGKQLPASIRQPTIAVTKANMATYYPHACS